MDWNEGERQGGGKWWGGMKTTVLGQKEKIQ